MKSTKTNRPDFEFFAKATERFFVIENPYSRAKYQDFLKKNNGKWIKHELFKKREAKSREILGYWHGGILPSFVCHNKGITWKDEPFFVRDLLKSKKITVEEIDDAHNTLMTEFRPVWVDDLRTKKPTKQRGEMKKMGNKEVMELISEVLVYFGENGYAEPDSIEYKKIRDGYKLIKQEGTQDYPEFDSSKMAF